MAVVKTSPMKVDGPWVDGFVLDFHSTGAIPTGDPYHPFEMTYTELGSRLYRFKYRSDHAVFDDIVDTAVNFVNNWGPTVDCIVVSPPSMRRDSQPTIELGRAIAGGLGVPLYEDAVRKAKDTPPMKNVSSWDERRVLLAEAIQAGEQDVKGKSVLLFDDLIQSGSTLRRVAEVLLEIGGVGAVHALVLTRTR
jgi:competence protein ComFC